MLRVRLVDSLSGDNTAFRHFSGKFCMKNKLFGDVLGQYTHHLMLRPCSRHIHNIDKDWMSDLPTKLKRSDTIFDFILRSRGASLKSNIIMQLNIWQQN
jgi:hypothetical protein